MVARNLFKTVLLVLALCFNSIFAATYYVDAVNGNDSNNGTSPSTAWNSISKVNSMNYSAGDNILFQRGQKWTGMLIPSTSGTSSARITYGAYGTGVKPIITTMQIIPNSNMSGSWSTYSGNIWRISYSLGGAGIDRLWLGNKEYLRAESPSAVNSTNRWMADGSTLYVYATSNPASNYSGVVFSGGIGSSIYTIKIKDKDYITLENLDVQGGYTATIGIGGSDYLIIQDCNIGYGAYGRGIGANMASVGASDQSSDNGIVRRDTIYSGWDLFAKYDLSISDGISLQNGANYWEVYDSYFKNWGHSAIQIYGITANTNYNKVYRNVFTAPDLSYGRAFETVGSDSNKCRFNEFFRNYVTHTRTRNQIGGYRNKAYYNIFDYMLNATVAHGGGTTAQAIVFASVAGPSKYNVAYNNTIYSLEREGIWDYGGSNQTVNNLIMDCGQKSSGVGIRATDNGLTGGRWKNNIIYTPGYTTSSYIVSWGSIGATINQFNGYNGSNGSSISGNLQFTGALSRLVKNAAGGDYCPAPGSPAIGKGINVGLTQDFYGNPVTGNPDIGAIQSGSSSQNNDQTPPRIMNAVLINSTTLKITFSEQVNPDYAQNPANYSINNSIQVQSAALDPNHVDVTLTTSAHAENVSYIVSIINVKDMAGNSISSTENSFSYILSNVTAANENNTLSGVPSKFELNQNYPNPFNPTTKIKYAISQATNVSIKIYDMLGKEVMTLVSGNHTPGYYEVSFDGAKLASGTYIYQLRTNQYVETKKMMLIK